MNHGSRVLAILPLLALMVWCAAAEDQPNAKPEGHEILPGLVAQEIRWEDTPFKVVRVMPDRTGDLQLYWRNPDGERFRTFGALRRHLNKSGRKLIFATNAGIYSGDYTPGGLHVEEGVEARPLNTREGGGNFHLMPNGVFFIDAEGPHVWTTSKYQEQKPSPRIATQSGPMLVIEGELHPKFQEDSDSAYIRNGVGVTEDGAVCFALARRPVNLHTFARFFRDELACPDALYLDGSISDMYVAGETDRRSPVGYVGILAIAVDKPS